MKDWRNKKASPNFTYGEFCVSASYPELAASIQPTKAQLDDFTILALQVLQPIRDKFGPTVIHSGYRDAALNKAVGGAFNSQHLTGKAVDIECPKASMRDVFEFAKTFWRGELLLYKYRGHLHIALPEFGVYADQVELHK